MDWHQCYRGIYSLHQGLQNYGAQNHTSEDCNHNICCHKTSNVMQEQNFVVTLPEQAGGYWKNSDEHP